MLTINSNWLAAMQQVNPQVRFIVTLQVDGSTSYSAVDGPVDFATTYPVAVSEVSPFAAEINLRERKATLSEMTVTFSGNGWAREIAIAKRLRGKKLIVKIGEKSLAEADYVTLFTGVIAKSPLVHPDNTVEVEAMNGMAVVRDTKITGYWIGMHPLQIIEDILDKAGVPSELIDAPSLDPSAYTSMSHFVASRGPVELGSNINLVIETPRSALSLLNSISKLVDGLFVDGEDGTLRFILFDSTASLDDTWTEDDILSIEPPDDADDSVINDVTVKFYYNGNDHYYLDYQLQDSDSIANYSYPVGIAQQSFADELATPWLNAACHLEAGESLDDGTVDGNGATFNVNGYGSCLHTMAGARWDGFPSGSPSADSLLSNTRTAFIKIDDEIIEVKGLSLSSLAWQRSIQDPSNPGTLVTIKVPYKGTYTIKTRGALDTTPAAHSSQASVFDYTVAVAMARARINRWCNGAPPLKVRTRLDKFAVQLGDFVGLVTTRYAAYGDDGLDANTKWEVVGKEIDRYSSDPGIKWTLQWVTKTAAAAPTEAHTARVPGAQTALQRSALSIVGSSATVGIHIDSGLVVAAGAGLTVTVTAGTLSATTYATDFLAETLTVPASQTCWIIADAKDGGLIVQTGATAPTVPSNQLILAKVVTGVASVTSVNGYTAKSALQSAIVGVHALNAAAEWKTSLIPNGHFGAWSRG